MQPNQYLRASARTASSLNVSTLALDNTNELLHAAMGMVTESAEFIDALKKWTAYGKPLDKANLVEELGDQLWYIAMAIRALDTTFEEVFRINIEKLQARYSNDFTQLEALSRDLAKERAVLEQVSSDQ